MQGCLKGCLEGCLEDMAAERASAVEGVPIVRTEAEGNGEKCYGWAVLDAAEERADVPPAIRQSTSRSVESTDVSERSTEAADARLSNRAKSELWTRSAAQERLAWFDSLSPTFDMGACPSPSRGPSSYWQRRLACEGRGSPSHEVLRSSSAAGRVGSRELMEGDAEVAGSEAEARKVDHAVQDGGANRCPSPPYCLGLGGRRRSRALQSALFERFLHADMARSAALGAREEESHMFVYAALGLLGPDLKA
eukprot:6209672-Pleurochrysis_carterae.AAC.1